MLNRIFDGLCGIEILGVAALELAYVYNAAHGQFDPRDTLLMLSALPLNSFAAGAAIVAGIGFTGGFLFLEKALSAKRA